MRLPQGWPQEENHWVSNENDTHFNLSAIAKIAHVLFQPISAQFDYFVVGLEYLAVVV